MVWIAFGGNEESLGVRAWQMLGPSLVLLFSLFFLGPEWILPGVGIVPRLGDLGLTSP